MILPERMVWHTFVNTCSSSAHRNILRRITTRSLSRHMEEWKTQLQVKTTPITTSILRMSSLQRRLTFSHNSSSSLFSLKRQRNVKWMPSIMNSKETCRMKHAERFRSKRRSLPVRLGPLIASLQAIYSRLVCLIFANNCYDITINTIRPT